MLLNLYLTLFCQNMDLGPIQRTLEDSSRYNPNPKKDDPNP